MSHQASSYVHPLMRKPVGSVQSAVELLERWTQEMAKEVPLAEELEGILFRVPSFDHAGEDLILLCLDVADGYRMSEYDLRLPDEGEMRHPDSGQLRLQVSRKAFWALAEGLFKDRRERHTTYLPSWARFVAQERVFKKIIWFIFDEKRGRKRDIYMNLPQRPGSGPLVHQERIFHTFAVDLVRFAWDFRGLGDRWGDERDTSVAEMFHQARPKLIRILCKVGELEMLKKLAPLDADYERRGLDGRERRVLRELAIGRYSAKGSGADVWKLVEKEVAEGNPAAEFLWCYLPRVKRLRRQLSAKRRKAREYDEERKRQRREALQRERDEAEKRLNALSEKPQ